MKLFKKIAVIAVTIMLAICLGTEAFAATNPVTFGLSEYRRETNGKQYGYRINNGNKKVWKVIVYENDGTTMNFDNTIYCLKAERGFYTATPNTFKQTYDKMLDFADKASLVPAIFENENYYYSAMWILDHAYIPYYAKAGDSVEVQAKKKEQAAKDREALLNATQMSDSLKVELTDDDIDVVQQMALWYFTNTKSNENSDIYHVDFAGEPSFQEVAIAEKGVGSYTTIADVNQTRADAMEKLYQYIVSNAKKDENIAYYKNNNGKITEPITLAEEVNPVVELDGSNYIVGPYKINKNNDIPFELETKFTDQNGTNLNGKYTLLNSNKEPVEDGKTIKDLIGQSFYINIPSSEIDDITKIEFSYTGSYRVTSKGFWTTTQNPDTVQPLVAVEKQDMPLAGKKEVGVAKREFDLALRKFISEVNGKEINREPTVDISNLNKMIDGTKVTTATYNHNKKPVAVKPGDVVTYTIRVYNEGELDGYVGEITDYLPPELEFINDMEKYPKETDFNAGYGWKIDASNSRIIKTNKLAYSEEAANKDQNANNLIKAYNGTTVQYKEVKVKCKVKNSTEALKKITNLAQITAETDSKGNSATDRDSAPNGNFALPGDTELPTYKDDEINSGKTYIPGQEDDDDFEKVIIQEFDLSLRKFISGKNGTTLIGRTPSVDTTKLANATATTAEYNHPKKPLDMKRGDVVEYTIRVYNEGSIDGYANKIQDKLPAELEFLPDHETNKTYEWQLAEDGRTVTTDYLSKEQEKNDGDNLLKAYDPEKGLTENNPDYRDVKIAFEVTEPNTSDRILVNTAEIKDDSDSSGDPIDDIDSTPNNNNEWNKEDDLDKEFVKVKYFDLSLKKWVSKAIIIDEDGKQTVQETGHTGDEDPEPPVKVDLGRRDINKVTVKFEFQIKVTNEGEIAGYAKEITDYIPEGLKFVEEDNPDWYRREELNGKERVATKKLENTLLMPGESSSVPIILTWINNQDNMGLKTNIAEISQDYNDSHTPDIDSVPDNFKENEDDIDDAPVMLTITLGDTKLYLGITALVIVALGGGIFIIKKYVL